MDTKRFVDIHCHPGMKPIGKSFKKKKPFKNSPEPSEKYSIWHMDPPTCIDKFFNKILSLTKFTQSDFTSLTEEVIEISENDSVKANVGLVNVCLGPLEKGFVKTRIGSRALPLFLVGLVTGVTRERLKYLTKTESYFRDIEKEMEYFTSLDSVEIEERRYKLISKKTELKPVTIMDTGEIQVVFSIEGANVFDIESAPESTVIDNIGRIKKWKFRPLWVSPSHHFYNEISGHSKTLPKVVNILVDQKPGINTGITPFGKEVIEKLLDDEGGKGILIDIKHFSRQSRLDFYKIRKEYCNSGGTFLNIPIIVSHSACNGWKSNEYEDMDGGEREGKLYATGFNNWEDLRANFSELPVNLTDQDIAEVAHSGGIIGIQLDQRRLGNHETFRRIRKNIRQKKAPYNDDNVYDKETLKKYWWSKPVWENIYYIARVIKQIDPSYKINPWSVQCIGSDFDGMINPLDYFWTAKDLNALRSGLLYHARKYAENEIANLPASNSERVFTEKTSYNSEKVISPDEVVNRIMTDNAYNFISRCLG
jgi:microsomal dipeptidase-like Zn-dependent dipeptidase